MSGELWAIVLAAGEGRRLAPLTARLYGSPLPKQFAVLRGRTSLLQDTIERIVPLVPPERIVVVAPVTHEGIARRQLSQWKGVHIVMQPQDRGTGPGILLGLAHVLEHDPDGWVCICPSDHTFTDAQALRVALRRAVIASRFLPLVTIGVRATRPETEYGWIRVSQGRNGFSTVQRFVEKPDAKAAERLLAEGALWNTFLMVGAACAIWEVAEERMPQHADAILACVPVTAETGRAELARTYADLEPLSFSREVLEREHRLGVIELLDPGWSDLGSPERVYEVLGRTGELSELEGRMRAAG